MIVLYHDTCIKTVSNMFNNCYDYYVIQKYSQFNELKYYFGCYTNVVH